ncbi:DinB family protein [Paenibacillus dakarensis]|uniref:DinB family protein n=1 Tax=Paenibacillus dakarensis TaxID=1527293 RepID=UPI0006D5453E|nr:DinB family protein [Paenibacillus dakarensis]
MKRPAENEYPDYFHNYVKLVPEGNLLDTLVEQQKVIQEMIPTISDSKANFRYAPGKWSVKEVFGHMIDTERIMSYRLLRIARGDKTPLAGFEENFYVEHAHYDQRSLDSLLEEYVPVRNATVSLMNGLAEEAWGRTGIANDLPISARAVAYIIAGHELHHLGILRERYLVG